MRNPLKRVPAPDGRMLSTLLPPETDTSDRWPVCDRSPDTASVHAEAGEMFSVITEGEGVVRFFLPSNPASPFDGFPAGWIVPPTTLDRQERDDTIRLLIGLAAGAHEHIRAHPNPLHSAHQHVGVMAHSHALLRSLLSMAAAAHGDSYLLPEESGTLEAWHEQRRTTALAVALYRHAIRECSDWTARRYAAS